LTLWCLVIFLNHSERIFRIHFCQRNYEDFVSPEIINLLTEADEEIQKPGKCSFFYKFLVFLCGFVPVFLIVTSSIALVFNFNYFAFCITIVIGLFYFTSNSIFFMQNIIEFKPVRLIWFILTSLFLIPLMLLTISISVQSVKETLYMVITPPPGKMIDIDGNYKLHLHCEGSGSPTVLFVHGLMGFSLDWSLMQPEISKHTKSCTFDRSGYGWSEFGPSSRKGDQIVIEINTLLAHEKVLNESLILVGHSCNK
jgi:hypothetical protein